MGRAIKKWAASIHVIYIVSGNVNFKGLQNIQHFAGHWLEFHFSLIYLVKRERNEIWASGVRSLCFQQSYGGRLCHTS